MSPKQKYHQNWNVTKTKMSPKCLRTFLVLSQDNQSLALIAVTLFKLLLQAVFGENVPHTIFLMAQSEPSSFPNKDALWWWKELSQIQELYLWNQPSRLAKLGLGPLKFITISQLARYLVNTVFLYINCILSIQCPESSIHCAVQSCQHACTVYSLQYTV